MATATEIMADQSKQRQLRGAMDRLLHKLRGWVRVYTRLEEDMDKLPDLDTAWVVGVDGDGPQKAILDAIKMHPDLWAEALPAECCIVHRETLKKYVGNDAAEYMAAHGANAVTNQAARLLYEAELRERADWYKSGIA